MTNPKDLVGAKKSALGVVPPALLIGTAPAMAVGANKYGPFNWRAQPVQVMTYIEAAMRHLLAFMDGQDKAEDTGVSHLAHAAASMGILMDAIAMDNVIDNRPSAGAAPVLLREQDHSVQPQGEMAESAQVSRLALSILVDQMPNVTMDWNGGDPVFTMNMPPPTADQIAEAQEALNEAEARHERLLNGDPLEGFPFEPECYDPTFCGSLTGQPHSTYCQRMQQSASPSLVPFSQRSHMPTGSCNGIHTEDRLITSAAGDEVVPAELPADIGPRDPKGDPCPYCGVNYGEHAIACYLFGTGGMTP